MHRGDRAWILPGSPLVLLEAPWTWVLERLVDIGEFFESGPGEALLVEGPVFLIVGGLSVLFLVASLLLLQSLVPSRPGPDPVLASPKDKRQLRPLYGGDALKGRLAPEVHGPQRRRLPATVPRIDVALASVLRSGLGEPRLVRSNGHHALVRLVGCRGCAGNTPPPPLGPGRGCDFEQRYFFDAFRTVFGSSVTVREPACRRQGAAWCEYEVEY